MATRAAIKLPKQLAELTHGVIVPPTEPLLSACRHQSRSPLRLRLSHGAGLRPQRLRLSRTSGFRNGSDFFTDFRGFFRAMVIQAALGIEGKIRHSLTRIFITSLSNVHVI
jgi:hypothetical protein